MVLIEGLELKNQHIRVVTILNAPYVFYDSNKIGNDRFSGFSVDLLDNIFEYLDMNTTYEIYIVPDGNYGGLVNGSWNGMIKEIMDGKADLALGDITITTQRMSEIDFTLPFLDVGLNILIPQPTNTLNLWWIFLPFSRDLWFSLLGTTLGMSILIYLSDRLSPYGYHRSKLRSNMDRFDYAESLLGALYILLGNNRDPGRSWAGRVLMLCYLAFSFIVLSFYNADLVASLTVQEQVATIQQLSDLAKPGTLFTTQINTATEAYFRQPGFEAYASQMILFPDYPSCLQALSTGKVQAIVSDSATQEYIVNTPPCDKWLVGGIFAESNFGIGLHREVNNTAKYLLSEAILKLRESGVVDNIYNTWWIVGGCDGDSNLATEQITFLKLAGAFALLSIFIGIGVGVLVIETLYYRWYHNPEVDGRFSIFKHIDRFFGNTAYEGDIRRAADIMLKKRKKPKDGMVPLDEDDIKVSY